jgi:hypothetical protein
LAQYLLLHFPRVNIRGANERPQRRLMLNLSGSRPACLLMPPRPPLFIAPSPPPLLRSTIRSNSQCAIVSSPPPLALFSTPSPLPLPLPLLCLSRARMRIPARIPTPLRPPPLPPRSGVLNTDFPQTQLPRRFHQPPIRILHPPLPQTHLASPNLHQNILSTRVFNLHPLLLGLRPAFVRIRSQEHLEQRGNSSIVFRVAHRRTA